MSAFTPGCLGFVGGMNCLSGAGFGGIPVNDGMTITYQAVANPQTCPATLTNQGMVTWTSLPGPNGTVINPTESSTGVPSGANNGERDGVTLPLLLNDYKVAGSAAVYCQSGSREICVTKFNDLNGNGVRDAGEPGLPGWTFTVAPGPPTSFTTLSPGGGLCFLVPAGTHTFTETLQTGWSPTTPLAAPSTTQIVPVLPGPVLNLSFGNKKKQ